MTTGVRATDVRPADGRVPDGRVPDGHIADGRVSDGHIADGRVSDGHIADGRVSDSHIAAGRISDGRVSAVQTAWAELIIATLADAGVEVCVVSPGSRSTPLVAALAGEPRLVTPVVIDERAAAFCALGAARATGRPVALVCTSGTAAAHWLPAVIEASEAGVPLIAITADRPPELHGCGAAQTIDQVKLFGGFVRGYIDLGPADGAALALRAVRRKIAQAVTLSRGPRPGPVHLEVPLRKPLEPVVERGVVDADDPFAIARGLRSTPLVIAPPPRASADDIAVQGLTAALARAERPLVIAGSMPLAAAARDAVLALARRAGAVVLAESGSGLRSDHRRSTGRALVTVDAFDPVLAARADSLVPDVIVQVGGEPVAAAWPDARTAWRGAMRWVIADHGWPDPDSSATGLVIGDVADTARRVARGLDDGEPRRDAWHAAWRSADGDARAAIDAAVDAAPDGEPAVVRAVLAAVPRDAMIVVGNSLPVRVIDHVLRTSEAEAAAVITQRGACGIDGLIAGAAGATWTGRPVVAIVGDVSFAHDVGGLAAAVRVATAPLVVVVIDNGGGRIFDGLPVARAVPPPVMATFFHTATGLDPAAVAAAVGATAITATSPATAAAAVTAAIRTPGVTVVHAPVAADGAQQVRRAAIARLASERRGARS